MNYPVNPDLMPALMAVFQHVRTRIQSELDCQRLDLTPPDVHVLKLIDEQRGRTCRTWDARCAATRH